MCPLILRRLDFIKFGYIFYKVRKTLSNKKFFSSLGITQNNMETEVTINALLLQSVHFQSITRILKCI